MKITDIKATTVTVPWATPVGTGLKPAAAACFRVYAGNVLAYYGTDDAYREVADLVGVDFNPNAEDFPSTVTFQPCRSAGMLP